MLASVDEQSRCERMPRWASTARTHCRMGALSGNAATMEGTAVSSDELWSLPELETLPNNGAFDHRYIESEDDAEKLLVPTVVSAGGFAVPSADW